MSTKSGKVVGVTPVGYINEASLLMQAVSSQMQTPHNGTKTGPGPKNQIQNNNAQAATSKTPVQGGFHKRKPSNQSSKQPPLQTGMRLSDQNSIFNELKQLEPSAETLKHQI